jgi:AcrR family transcriptional regulator
MRNVSAAELSTHDRIMQAAFELFLAQGIHGTAVTDIERAVGLTAGRGSFYKHFRSKDDLLSAVIEREVAARMQTVLASRAKLQLPKDQREALTLALRQTMADMAVFSDLLRLLVSDGDRVPQLRQIFGEALRRTYVLGDWIDDATRFVVLSALVGYQTFDIAGVSDFTDVASEEFVQALVRLVPTSRPPGVPKSPRAPRSF